MLCSGSLRRGTPPRQTIAVASAESGWTEGESVNWSSQIAQYCWRRDGAGRPKNCELQGSLGDRQDVPFSAPWIFQRATLFAADETANVYRVIPCPAPNACLLRVAPTTRMRTISWLSAHPRGARAATVASRNRPMPPHLAAKPASSAQLQALRHTGRRGITGKKGLRPSAVPVGRQRLHCRDRSCREGGCEPARARAR